MTLWHNSTDAEIIDAANFASKDRPMPIWYLVLRQVSPRDPNRAEVHFATDPPTVRRYNTTPETGEK